LYPIEAFGQSALGAFITGGFESRASAAVASGYPYSWLRIRISHSIYGDLPYISNAALVIDNLPGATSTQLMTLTLRPPFTWLDPSDPTDRGGGGNISWWMRTALMRSAPDNYFNSRTLFPSLNSRIDLANNHGVTRVSSSVLTIDLTPEVRTSPPPIGGGSGTPGWWGDYFETDHVVWNVTDYAPYTSMEFTFQDSIIGASFSQVFQQEPFTTEDCIYTRAAATAIHPFEEGGGFTPWTTSPDTSGDWATIGNASTPLPSTHPFLDLSGASRYDRVVTFSGSPTGGQVASMGIRNYGQYSTELAYHTYSSGGVDAIASDLAAQLNVHFAWPDLPVTKDFTATAVGGVVTITSSTHMSSPYDIDGAIGSGGASCANTLDSTAGTIAINHLKNEQQNRLITFYEYSGGGAVFGDVSFSFTLPGSFFSTDPADRGIWRLVIAGVYVITEPLGDTSADKTYIRFMWDKSLQADSTVTAFFLGIKF
jgi:hypothetical protein